VYPEGGSEIPHAADPLPTEITVVTKSPVPVFVAEFVTVSGDATPVVAVFVLSRAVIPETSCAQKHPNMPPEPPVPVIVTVVTPEVGARQ
jgi:hypothetical protein